MLFRGQQDSFQAREDLILGRQKLRQGGKAVSRSFSDHFLSVRLKLQFFYFGNLFLVLVFSILRDIGAQWPTEGTKMLHHNQS
jgi:hypothetical protein